MAPKLRKTLPRDFEALLAAARTSGSYAAVHAVFEKCEVDATDGFAKGTALMNAECTPALARWLVARGADVNARDTWGNTPLHESAFARFHHHLRPAALLALGADVHAKTKSGLTPLHKALDGQNLASARVLLEHGADLAARDRQRLTPLEYALSRMSNIDLESMFPLARAMLEAGATRSARAKESVKRAAQTFEFHRAGFAKGSVAAASAASLGLCALFGVEPPPRRVLHDGKAPIISRAKTWQKQHAELWKLLVPSSGPCATVQGEVIRISGRVGDEVHRNGAANWDRAYDQMVAAFCQHVASRKALPTAQVAECKALRKKVRSTDGATDRLAELAVAWVALNPKPAPLPAPRYAR